MKRLGILFILFSLLLSVFIGCQAQFEPGTYTDDIGRVLAIDQIPQRIISFGPSITEILFALGLEERVVGVSSYCDYPKAAELKAEVGDAFSPSLEKIVELEPDLVFTVKHEALNNQLENLGITFVVLDPKDIDGILADIELVGRVTGTEDEAEAIVADMQDRISQISALVQDVPAVSVFFIVDATDLTLPWTTGAGSFIDALITLAGGENTAGGTEGDWLQFSLEQIVSADPAVIVVQTMTGGVPTVSKEELEEHAVWGQLAAVEHDKIYFIDGDLVSRPGPRIIQGLEEIALITHPEIFEQRSD